MNNKFMETVSVSASLYIWLSEVWHLENLLKGGYLQLPLLLKMEDRSFLILTMGISVFCFKMLLNSPPWSHNRTIKHCDTLLPKSWAFNAYFLQSKSLTLTAVDINDSSMIRITIIKQRFSHSIIEMIQRIKDICAFWTQS